MRCRLKGGLFVLICSLASGLVAQQQGRVIRVGVAVMQNAAGRSVPGTLERDRLVRALNQLKPDKKTGVSIRGIPLEGSTPAEVKEQLAEHNCDYVVYTTLTELRTAGDPYQHRPGTIETNPDSQFGRPQTTDPEFRATVEFRLARAGSASEIAGAPYSTQQPMPEVDVVSQVMDRIANNVWSEIRKDLPSR